jgi:hypothetical protein
MGKCGLLSGVFLILFWLSAVLGAIALALFFIPILRIELPGMAQPFFSVSAICAVVASLLVLCGSR